MTRNFIPAIASQSLGNAAHHSLPNKLSLCASHGFHAVELFYEDLESTARALPPSYAPCPAHSTFPMSTTWQEKLLAAASYISDLCKQLSLEVLCLQPFMHYGGIIDRRRHAERIEEMRFWILLAQRLRTDLIQVPSSFLSESVCTKDLEAVAKDMREIADLGVQHNPQMRFCYEALAWGTQVDHWEQAWEVVKMVDRPNFGTCLDTFNLCGRVYADPASPSGVSENAEQDMRNSIEMLRERLEPKKIFYVEACDGEKLEQPLDEHHPFYVEGQPPRMSWSRNARLFPLEEKGYLPIIETLEAILDSGYTGYISFEFFSRTANNPSPNVPEEHVRRAQESWQRLSERMGWDQDDKSTQAFSKHESKAGVMPNPQPLHQTLVPATTFGPAARSLTPMLEAH